PQRLSRRSKPRQYPRRNRQRNRQSQRAPVQRNVLPAGHPSRHAGRHHGQHHLQIELRQHQSTRRPGKPQQHALRQQLPQQPRPLRPQSGAHRHLVAPPQPPRKLQVGHISAHNQQHNARSRQNQLHNQRSQRPGHIFQQRLKLYAPTHVRRRIRLRQPRRNPVHLCLRRRYRYARAQPPDHVILARIAVPHLRRASRKRYKQVCRQRIPKRLRHYADHCVSAPVQFQPLSHNARIAAKLPLPQTVGQQRLSIASGVRVFSAKGPPHQRIHPHQPEVIWRNCRRLHPSRSARARQVQILIRPDGQPFKRPALLRPILIVSQRNPFRSVAVLYLAHRHHSVQLRNRQRAQHRSIRNAEHRRVHANSNRQRQNRRHRKPRRLPQLPQSEFHIIPHAQFSDLNVSTTPGCPIFAAPSLGRQRWDRYSRLLLIPQRLRRIDSADPQRRQQTCGQRNDSQQHRGRCQSHRIIHAHAIKLAPQNAQDQKRKPNPSNQSGSSGNESRRPNLHHRSLNRRTKRHANPNLSLPLHNQARHQRIDANRREQQSKPRQHTQQQHFNSLRR